MVASAPTCPITRTTLLMRDGHDYQFLRIEAVVNGEGELCQHAAVRKLRSRPADRVPRDVFDCVPDLAKEIVAAARALLVVPVAAAVELAFSGLEESNRALARHAAEPF